MIATKRRFQATNDLQRPRTIITRCKKFVRLLVYTPHKTFSRRKTDGQRNGKKIYKDAFTDEISELVEKAHAIFSATTVTEVMDMRDR